MSKCASVCVNEYLSECGSVCVSECISECVWGCFFYFKVSY